MNYLVIEKTPNYKKAVHAAYETLRKHRITDFPINIFELMNRHDDLIVMSYQDFSKRFGLSMSEVIEMCCSDEGCISYEPRIKKYIILFNDDVSKSLARVRFTLCHEYGHYILKHAKITDRFLLSRYSITDEEDDILETEANIFARELLAPTFLVNLIEPLNAHFISNYFFISEQASEYIINHIHNCRNNGWNNILSTPFFLRGQLKQIRMSLELNMIHSDYLLK